MTVKHALPAKLTRPAATGLIRRERLFETLDAGSDRKLLWVSGPGGAGKTSLVSTYVEARRVPCVWYQVDAGDADLATFFHYMLLAARGYGRGEPLQMFSPAHLAELDIFARRFFEAVLSRLEGPVTFVFDNYQEVAANARLHEVMHALVGSLPERARVIVGSRGEPPAALARWQASPEFLAVDWEQLRFSASESGALAGSWGVATADEVNAVHALSRGWAAGTVLLLRAARGGVALTRTPDTPPRALFNYFAAEIFARIPPPTQDFLLKTAFLPTMTPALAELLTGEPRAARILAELNRDNFFTERKAQAEAVYEYHPLFREFLVERFAEALGEQALGEVRRRAAALLDAAGQTEPAAQLLMDASDWDELRRFIESHAEGLVGRAQFQTVRAWIDAVPEPIQQRSPWLLLWRGVCEVAAREPSFRATFDAARSRFDAASDAIGSCATRCWLIRTTDSPEEVRGLLDELQSLVDRAPELSDPKVELQLIGQLRPDSRAPPWHPLIARWVERADELARTLSDPSQRLRMAAYACSGYALHGDLARLKALVEAARDLLNAPQLAVRDRVNFLVVQIFWDYFRGVSRAEPSGLAQLLHLADTSRFVLDQAVAWTIAMRVASDRGDIHTAQRLGESLYAIVRFSPSQYPLFLTSRVCVNFCAHDLEGAARDVAELLRAVPPSSLRWPITVVIHGQLLLEQGQTAAAHARLTEAVTLARERRSSGPLQTGLLLLALAEHRLGRHSEAREHLREGLALGRELDCAPRYPYVGDRLLSELFALALTNGIELAYVRELIARLRLAPPAPELEHWPWPVRIRVLGGLAVERSEPVAEDENAAGKKKPRKPLELLKYLVAQGEAGTSVAAATDALWPDAEGDAARKSFDMALLRLRKILGNESAVLLESGRLTLNPTVVWVDSLAFERIAMQIDEQASGDASLAELGLRAIGLYRGHFLATEQEAGWAAPRREHLRARFLRLVEACGMQFEATDRRSEAERLYRKAIDLDPLAESIYRRLMRSLAGRGQAAEAMAVYRRCREILSILLGAKPSAETEAVYQAVRAS